MIRPITVKQKKQLSSILGEIISDLDLQNFQAEILLKDRDNLKKYFKEKLEFTIENECLFLDIDQQIKNLSKFMKVGQINKKLSEKPFPNTGFVSIYQDFKWYAIPRWEKFAPVYVDALQIVIDLIKQFFGDKFEYVLDLKNLRPHKTSLEMFERIAKKQVGYDILTIPAKFNFLNNYFFRRASNFEINNINIFNLDTFTVAIMILTHKEQILHYLKRIEYKKIIACAGDEYALNRNGDFNNSPIFYLNRGKLTLGTSFIDKSINGLLSAIAITL